MVAWHGVAWPTRDGIETHAQDDPSKEEVASMVETHREEFMRVCNVVGR